MINRTCWFLVAVLILVVFITLITVGLSSTSKAIEEDTHQDPSILVLKDENDALDEFKKMVLPEELYADFMKQDAYLLRWIRDSDNDLKKTEEKLRMSLKWRLENGIDNILEEDFSEIERQCPYTFGGHDMDGSPIAVIPFGKWKLRKILVSGNMPRLNRMIYYVLEKAATLVMNTTEAGKDGRLVGIIDFKGFSFIEHGCLKCVPLISIFIKTYEANYPEYIKHWYIINVPRFGQSLIDLFLPILSPKSKEVTKVFGYNRAEWTAEFLKTISPDQLPFQFAPSNKTAVAHRV